MSATSTFKWFFAIAITPLAGALKPRSCWSQDNLSRSQSPPEECSMPTPPYNYGVIAPVRPVTPLAGASVAPVRPARYALR